VAGWGRCGGGHFRGTRRRCGARAPVGEGRVRAVMTPAVAAPVNAVRLCVWAPSGGGNRERAGSARRAPWVATHMGAPIMGGHDGHGGSPRVHARVGAPRHQAAHHDGWCGPIPPPTALCCSCAASAERAGPVQTTAGTGADWPVATGRAATCAERMAWSSSKTRCPLTKPKRHRANPNGTKSIGFYSSVRPANERRMFPGFRPTE